MNDKYTTTSTNGKDIRKDYLKREEKKRIKLIMDNGETSQSQVGRTQFAHTCETREYNWDARSSHTHVRCANITGTHASCGGEQITRDLKWNTRKSHMSAQQTDTSETHVACTRM